MADGSGGHGGLYFIVGALVVVVAVLIFAVAGGRMPFGDRHVDVKVESPVHAPGK